MNQVASEAYPVEEAILAARFGDRDAWEDLYDLFHDEFFARLESRIPQRLASRFDPEDVIQAAFLRVFEHIGSVEFRGLTEFTAWMTNVMDSALADWIKYHRRARRDPMDELTGESLPGLPVQEPSPDEVQSSREQCARLSLAMSRLPAELRHILELRYDDQRSWRQIAVALHCSRSTARRRVSVAVDQLSREYESSSA